MVIASQNIQQKPGYKQTEVGVIPEDWEVKKLSEIGECIIGLTYQPSNVKSDGLLVLRSSNIENDELTFTDNVFVDVEVSDKLIVRDGDILVCVRNGSRNLIGKCALINDRAKGMTFGAFMSVFRSRSGYFIFYQFQSDLIKKQINENIGATINQITNKNLNSFQIPFPKEEKERQIIATVLSDVDTLITSLDQLIAKKRDIKHAMMQQLLTGKTRLPGFSGEWNVKRLEEVAEISMGGTPSRRNQNYWGRGYKWLSIADLKSKYVFETKEEITTLAASNMTVIPKGTLVMSFKLTLGRLAFTGCDMYSNEAICNFTKLRVDAEYLYYILKRTNFSLYGKQAVKGYTLNTDSLNSVEIPYPEIPEQQAIATVLSDMDAEIVALEQRRDKTRALKQGMMQELLTGKTRLL